MAGRLTLVEGDCRGVVPLLGAFDVVVADPPYGITPLEWDRLVRGWGTVARAALRSEGSAWLFGSMVSLVSMVGEMEGWRVAQDIVWEKPNGSGATTHRRLRRVHELVLHLYRDDSPWDSVFCRQLLTEGHVRKSIPRRAEHSPGSQGNFGSGSYDSTTRVVRSVVHFAPPRREERVHPAQKPEGLVELLLRVACPAGGRVLDPFCGSGVVLSVARRLGLDAVGVDLDVSCARRLLSRG